METKQEIIKSGKQDVPAIYADEVSVVFGKSQTLGKPYYIVIGNQGGSETIHLSQEEVRHLLSTGWEVKAHGSKTI